MGNTPLVAITDEMLPLIVPLFQSNGIDCETIPLAESDDPDVFLLLLRCSRAGGIVRVSVQREPHVNPGGPVVVYEALYLDREHNPKSIALEDLIAHILKERGAWIPEPDAR